MLSFTPHEYEAPIPESLTRGSLSGNGSSTAKVTENTQVYDLWTNRAL